MTSAADMLYVLVVDDETSIHEVVASVLSDLPCEIAHTHTFEQAKSWLSSAKPTVILLDVDLPDANGIERADELKDLAPYHRLILMTGKNHVSHIAAATLSGAYDFISKNAEFSARLRISTRNALDALRSDVPTGHTRETVELDQEVIAQSSKMRLVLADVSKLSASRVNVLIEGPSGTGKEVVARAIHGRGERRDRPFIAVNCAGIPDALLESELFGYERGAFTGAVSRRIGRFEAAQGGTILLDEIGEMSLPLQAKLLRVVQDGGFERLGGSETIKADVRIIAATNRDLSAMVQQRTFREDLYYRLAVFTLNLPPLTERKDDIEPLLMHFLKRACADEGRTTLPQVSNEVLWVMHHHSWPGNVRQLQNVVKHAVVVGDSSLVKIGDLPSSFTRQLDRDDVDSTACEDSMAESALIEGDASTRLDQALQMAFPDTSVLPSSDDLQSAGTRLVMKRLKNNRKRTAQVLGVSRATLYRRIAADPSLTE